VRVLYEGTPVPNLEWLPFTSLLGAQVPRRDIYTECMSVREPEIRKLRPAVSIQHQGQGCAPTSIHLALQPHERKSWTTYHSSSGPSSQNATPVLQLNADQMCKRNINERRGMIVGGRAGKQQTRASHRTRNRRRKTVRNTLRPYRKRLGNSRIRYGDGTETVVKTPVLRLVLVAA
jgi:hypothetical protein